MSLTVGIDVGTQGVKGLVVDGDSSRVLARCGVPLTLLPVDTPGAAEQNPEDWWDAVRKTMAKLLAAVEVDPQRIVGIGISGQQHGSVFLDRDDQVLRPAKLWCDTSTAREAEEISARLGGPVPVGFTASKVAWLAKVEPEAWGRTATVLLPHDFINLRLTGARVAEAGDASGTGYFDPKERTWDPAALAAVDPALADRVPPLVAEGTAIGTLSADLAAEWGLSKDVSVSTGGGDNMMSAIGAGATRAGVVVTSLGTSATVFTRTDAPVIDPGGEIAPFCSSDGAWLPLLCTMNATNAVEEVREAFAIPVDQYDAWTAEAAQVPAGADGVRFIPFFHGERVPPLPHATASVSGLRPGSFRRDVLLRAVLEGTTANLALGVDGLRSLGVTVDTIHLVGGGAKNPLWQTLVADLFDAAVHLPAEAESAALGGAIQALWTARRQEQADLSIDEVATPFLRFDRDPVSPDPDRQAALRPVLAEYRQQIADLRASSASS